MTVNQGHCCRQANISDKIKITYIIFLVNLVVDTLC